VAGKRNKELDEIDRLKKNEITVWIRENNAEEREYEFISDPTRRDGVEYNPLKKSTSTFMVYVSYPANKINFG
jgi:hypothetical protein